jgi:ribonuclease III
MKWLSALFKRRTKGENEILRFVAANFGYRPKKLGIFKQALRHSSAAKKNGKGVKDSNERLEYLGDAVLDTVIAEYLYHAFPDTPEGDLTKMKAKVVNRRTLNKVGHAIKLVNLLELKMGKQDLHPSIIGNAFEAIIGAIYLERGFTFTNRAVLELMKRHGLEELVHTVVDFKSKLHEWCQKEKRTLEFQVIKETQQGGESFFEIAVLVNNKYEGRGKGKSKKAAEQLAAEEACLSLF